jgi:hypothetical protein
LYESNRTHWTLQMLRPVLWRQCIFMRQVIDNRDSIPLYAKLVCDVPAEEACTSSDEDRLLGVGAMQLNLTAARQNTK